MKLVKDTDKLKDKKHQISDKTAEDCIKTIIQWIGENPEREGLKSTPRRVIKSFKEYFQGYKENPSNYLMKHQIYCRQLILIAILHFLKIYLYKNNT